MSGDNRRREDEEGEGWGSMLMKVAGAAAATAAVAGGIYALLKQPSQEREVAFGARAVPNREVDERIVWNKPMIGWVKLNVDGSLWPQSASAGCGGVLRDSSGEWLGGFAKKLTSVSKVDETEKKAILEGLKWAWKRGERNVMVESDNEGVVKLVKSGRSNDRDICEIREHLERDWQASLTWIDGRANQVADKVAHNAHTLEDDSAICEFHSPPLNCILALSKDKQ